MSKASQASLELKEPQPQGTGDAPSLAHSGFSHREPSFLKALPVKPASLQPWVEFRRPQKTHLTFTASWKASSSQSSSLCVNSLTSCWKRDRSQESNAIPVRRRFHGVLVPQTYWDTTRLALLYQPSGNQCETEVLCHLDHNKHPAHSQSCWELL